VAYGFGNRWSDADGAEVCAGRILALKTEGCFSTARIWYDAFCPFSIRFEGDVIAVPCREIRNSRDAFKAEDTPPAGQAVKRLGRSAEQHRFGPPRVVRCIAAWHRLGACVGW
jgi:hypothetical protein